MHPPPLLDPPERRRGELERRRGGLGLDLRLGGLLPPVHFLQSVPPHLKAQPESPQRPFLPHQCWQTPLFSALPPTYAAPDLQVWHFVGQSAPPPPELLRRRGAARLRGVEGVGDGVRSL